MKRFHHRGMEFTVGRLIVSVMLGFDRKDRHYYGQLWTLYRDTCRHWQWSFGRWA